MDINTRCIINCEYIVEAKVEKANDKISVIIKAEDIPKDCKTIDFCPEFLVSGCDENGYAVVPRGTKEGGTMLCPSSLSDAGTPLLLQRSFFLSLPSKSPLFFVKCTTCAKMCDT